MVRQQMSMGRELLQGWQWTGALQSRGKQYVPFGCAHCNRGQDASSLDAQQGQCMAVAESTGTGLKVDEDCHTVDKGNEEFGGGKGEGQGKEWIW